MTMRRIDLQPLEPFTSDFIDRTGAFNPGALEAVSYTHLTLPTIA